MTDTELNKVLSERIQLLPKVVRDAIASADIKKRLQELSQTYQLHLDQWQLLENEVMLTLVGFEEPERLQENIKKAVGVSEDVAAALTAGVSHIVYEPIRQELERELEHPEAKAKEVNSVEAARESILQKNAAQDIAVIAEPATLTPTSQPPTPAIQPATPPSPPPTEKAVRAPSSGSYKHGEASTARKDIHDDPYREPPA